MSSFWPRGIELDDTQSPGEILQNAQQDWETSSSGVLALVLQEDKTQSGHDMIIVHAKHVPRNRTTTLFSIIHRPDLPYPATIQPRDDDLPNFLRKSYYHEEFGNITAGLKDTVVNNEWVCDTPTEFRKKLEEAFNLSVIKTKVLNLVSSNRENTGTTEKYNVDGDH